MNMIIHPFTKQIMPEDMFQSIEGWQNIKFLYATNCREVETETHFLLIGEVNGKEFVAKLPHDEYFEGKFFIYDV
jgi:hypothetical protein